MYFNDTRVINFKEIQATSTLDNSKQETHQPRKKNQAGLSKGITRVSPSSHTHWQSGQYFGSFMKVILAKERGSGGDPA